MASLSIGFIGGIPSALGAGGGLELQMASTEAALEGMGHRVVRVEGADVEERIDLLHAFHAEPQVWQIAPHWTRNRCPLVVSPVLPVRPRWDTGALYLSARVPGVITTARMRRDVLRRADAIVALTAYERRLIERVFGADPERIAVIGNGVDPVDDEGADLLPEGIAAGEFLLMVGGVSGRKQQVEVAKAVAADVPVVVVGGLVGDDAERAALERDLSRSGAVWLGHIGDRGAVRAIQRRAGALVLLSEAEAEPLVLLEALSVGTPVLASDLPAHRELAERYPGWVTLVPDANGVGPAWAALDPAVRAEPPRVPTWGDVAERLLGVYNRVLRRDGAVAHA